MPNHFHGILIVTQRMNDECNTVKKPSFGSPIAGSVAAIVGAYKSAVTREINRLRNVRGISVWQSNYYEHIIRDDEGFYRIRAYIEANPLRWSLDRENPARTGYDEFDQWLDSL